MRSGLGGWPKQAVATSKASATIIIRFYNGAGWRMSAAEDGGRDVRLTCTLDGGGLAFTVSADNACVLGRPGKKSSRACNLIIPNASVSQRHCRIWVGAMFYERGCVCVLSVIHMVYDSMRKVRAASRYGTKEARMRPGCRPGLEHV